MDSLVVRKWVGREIGSCEDMDEGEEEGNGRLLENE